MFQLRKTIVSEDIIEKDFVCNLSACKGACCVHGEAGAPLEKKETKILEEIYPKIKPFLRKEGIEAIEKQGTWITSDLGERSRSSLINEVKIKMCVYSPDIPSRFSGLHLLSLVIR